MNRARVVSEEADVEPTADSAVLDRDDMARVAILSRARDEAEANGDPYFFRRAIEARALGGVPSHLVKIGVTPDLLAELAEMETAQRGSSARDAAERAEHFRRESQKLEAEAQRFDQIVARAEADHRAATDLRLKLQDQAHNLARKKDKLEKLRGYHARFLRLGLLKGKHYFDALERARDIVAIDVAVAEITKLQPEVARMLKSTTISNSPQPKPAHPKRDQME